MNGLVKQIYSLCKGQDYKNNSYDDDSDQRKEHKENEKDINEQQSQSKLQQDYLMDQDRNNEVKTQNGIKALNYFFNKNQEDVRLQQNYNYTQNQNDNINSSQNQENKISNKNTKLTPYFELKNQSDKDNSIRNVNQQFNKDDERLYQNQYSNIKVNQYQISDVKSQKNSTIKSNINSKINNQWQEENQCNKYSDQKQTNQASYPISQFSQIDNNQYQTASQINGIQSQEYNQQLFSTNYQSDNSQLYSQIKQDQNFKILNHQEQVNNFGISNYQQNNVQKSEYFDSHKNYQINQQQKNNFQEYNQNQSNQQTINSKQNLFKENDMQSSICSFQSFDQSVGLTNYQSFDCDFLSITQTTQIKCQYCGNEINQKYIQLNCQHFYCLACLKEYLINQSQNSTCFIYKCSCSKKIKLQQLLFEQQDRVIKVLNEKIIINQLNALRKNIQNKFQVKICRNKNCQFFTIIKEKQNLDYFYCPLCLEKQYENQLKKE